MVDPVDRPLTSTTMSKRKRRDHELSRPRTQISAKTIKKVNEIKKSARLHAGEGISSDSEEEVEEEKRRGRYRHRHRYQKCVNKIGVVHTSGVVSRTLASYHQLLEGEVEEPSLDILQFTASWSCLICLSSVRRLEAVWNCDQCACMFHLQCVQLWAKDSLSLSSSLSPHLFPDLAAARTWSCPKCRRNYTQSQIPTLYYCFCKKTVSVCLHVCSFKVIVVVP